MKKCTKIILVLLGCFLMSSCQNSTKQNNFHYEKQEKSLVLETGVCDAYFKGNYCYILTLDGLTKMDLLSNDTEKIPVSAGEYSNVVKYTVPDDGYLYLLVKRGEGVFEIECFDENGIQKYSMEINEFEQIPDKFEADTNGNLFFLTDNKLIIPTCNGEIYKIDEFVYIQDFVIGDNCFYVAGVLQTERVICSYNSADGKKIETYTQLPDVSAGNGLFYSEDGIIVNSGVELLKQKNEYEELLQLTKFGIDGADLISVFFHEKKIYVVFYDETEDIYTLANFEKKDGGEDILTLAVYYIDSNLKQQVIDYNKNSNGVKIEIRDYSAYSYDEAVKKMNIDIVSGNTPDIINLTTFNEVRQYAKKGLLADLSGVVDEYAGTDEELFMNVLNASRINGRLYSITPDFSMQVLLGRTGSQDEKLDYEDIAGFGEQGSEAVFYAQNSEMFLMYTLIGTMENYVNYEEKECEFRTDQFEKTLIQARNYQNGMSEEEVAERIQAGESILMPALISDVYDAQKYYDLFNGNISYWGYPCDDGNEIIIQAGYGYLAVCEGTRYFDEAWAFLEGVLSEESQARRNHLYIPINQKTEWESVNNSSEIQYIETRDGNAIEEVRKTFTFGEFHDEIMKTDIEVRNIYQEMLQESNVRIFDVDLDIYAIISEEANYYLNGNRPFEEVADNITNRVNILLAEQY